MTDLRQKGYFKNSKLREISMSEFIKLPIIEQLDYFVLYIDDCKKNFSRFPQGSVITPAQTYAMVNSPATGQDNKAVNKKQNTISKRKSQREEINF